jgi:arabinofuranan 3-O-arabinosyltransferase
VAGGYAAVDGDPTTAWWAAPDDRSPTLTLRWPGPRRVSGLRLTLPPDPAATRPFQVQLTSPAGSRLAPLDLVGRARFPALVTDRVTLSFPRTLGASTVDRHTLRRDPLPLAISEVTLDGVPHRSRTDWPATMTVPCGQGPDVQVDGQPLPTGGTASVLDLLTQRPVELRVCADPLTLRPGRHTLLAPAGRLFNPTAAYLGRPPAGGPGSTGDFGSASGSRAGSGSGVVGVRPVSWGATNRTVQVVAGRAAVLVVHENANAGWRATVDGRALAPMRVDGWQQGFLVPAGTSGLVTLRYAPDAAYRLSLLAGLLGVLLLVGLAVLPERRRPPPPPPGPAAPDLAAPDLTAPDLTASAALAGADAPVPRSRPLATVRDWPPWLALLVAGWLAGLPGLLVGTAVLALRWRRLLWRLRGEVWCGVLVVLAGVSQALSLQYGTALSAGLGAALGDWLPQALCLVAWLGLLVAAVPPTLPPRPEPTAATTDVS